MNSEHAAREILVKQWNSFLAADRGSCYRLTTTGTPGTYTELLTCLEMKRDARKLPDSSTIGQGLRRNITGSPIGQKRPGSSPGLFRCAWFTNWRGSAAVRNA